MSEEVQVFYEATPNPQSMKFVCTREITSEPVNFTTPQEADRSPLAAKIFGFPWADGVMLGANFVTVTKQDWVEWDVLAEPLSNLIKEHLQSDQPILLQTSQNESTEDDSPIVQKIKEILNTEIRPAVAMDGGDIIFHKFEENKVYLAMHGACAGCPSSTMTLKMGIETRLKEAIPEIDEVVAI